MKKEYHVYILSNWNNRVIYIGVTNNLPRRIYEHQNKLVDGFTKKYNLNKLVYYEGYLSAAEAIAREKMLKGWSRQKKNDLIGTMNSTWRDLSNDF